MRHPALPPGILPYSSTRKFLSSAKIYEDDFENNKNSVVNSYSSRSLISAGRARKSSTLAVKNNLNLATGSSSCSKQQLILLCKKDGQGSGNNVGINKADNKWVHINRRKLKSNYQKSLNHREEF